MVKKKEQSDRKIQANPNTIGLGLDCEYSGYQSSQPEIPIQPQPSWVGLDCECSGYQPS